MQADSSNFWLILSESKAKYVMFSGLSFKISQFTDGTTAEKQMEGMLIDCYEGC